MPRDVRPSDSCTADRGRFPSPVVQYIYIVHQSMGEIRYCLEFVVDIWNQTTFRLVPIEEENCKHNQIIFYLSGNVDFIFQRLSDLTQFGN